MRARETLLVPLQEVSRKDCAILLQRWQLDRVIADQHFRTTTFEMLLYYLWFLQCEVIVALSRAAWFFPFDGAVITIGSHACVAFRIELTNNVPVLSSMHLALICGHWQTLLPPDKWSH